jgi:hypothetical protein
MTLGDVVFLAAAIQLTSTSDVKENLASAEALIRRAAGHGAQLIVTPENTNYLGPHDHKVRIAEAMDGPTVALFTSLAEELALHLVVGSFNERSEEPDRCYNTSIPMGPFLEHIENYIFSTSIVDPTFGSRSPRPPNPATTRPSSDVRWPRWAYRYATTCASRNCIGITVIRGPPC